MLRRTNKSQGQALVEFALIITVLLMIMFLIVESARILQGWVTVQNAARTGARYAITGQNMDPCPTESFDKFSFLCDGLDENDDPRVASIITTTHVALAGLPLDNDPAANPYGYPDDGIPPDPKSYDIQVWGGRITDEGAVLEPNFAGSPGQPVVVRAVYNVPIITPFFRPIIEVIPVFGQVTMNNENFGSLGNPTEGLGLPPDLDEVPTIGASPTPSPTPTITPTPTEGIPSATPTTTQTPTPEACGVYFEAQPVAGDSYVIVSGEVGETVTIIDQTTGVTLGTDTFITVGGYTCEGLVDFDTPQLSPLLEGGHLLVAQPNYAGGQPDTAFVIPGTPTPSATPTQVVPPTGTATSTPTATSTSTPSGPYITLIPACGLEPQVQFQVFGANWPDNESIAMYWNGVPHSIIPSGHGGSFINQWVKNVVGSDPDNPNEYEVRAQSASHIATAIFEVPCFNVPVPTLEATFTPTPEPADLIVVGPPEILSTRPLVAYQPIDVRLVISNTGGIDVSSQFFVDLYFDPIGTISPTIGVTQSVGYMAVSALDGGASRGDHDYSPAGL